MPKILFATHNLSKIKRYQEILLLPHGWELTTPEIEGFVAPEVQENGENEWENAKLKALAYHKVSGLNVFALDTGVYFEGLKPEDQPGKDVQRKAGVKDNTTPQERFSKMISYYQNLVSSFSKNDQLEGYFLDVFCLFDGKEYFKAEAKRPIILTTEIHGRDDNFPIASLYKIPGTGKYYHQLSPEELNQKHVLPSTQALQKLISDYVTKFGLSEV